MNDMLGTDRYYLEKDRIPVFIGKKGTQKHQFEEVFKCKLDINSNTGEVIVEDGEAVDNFVLSNVIHAINFGHSPESALELRDENFVLDSIDVKRKVRDHKRLKIVMGRIIGKDGGTRRLIEEITKCSVAVKDSIVSVIGPYENIMLVHEALDMLINGSSHKSFYGFLERNRTKMDTGLL
jgi:ribosomal RNA assembly protein